MNREAVPLILAILTPVILVILVLLHIYRYDTASYIISYLRKVDIIYYIIIIPFALGLFSALLKLRKPR